jgi:uncharacterized membrane protein
MTAWRRLPWLDAARGLAVVAMVAYHFVWDLGNFDYIDSHFPYSLQFKSIGHGIALSFLFIAGVSLVLAHERDASFGPFWRRVARIAAAAALVTLGTYLVFPQSFVFFGILHCIAAASLLAAPFLFLPWPAALLAAAAAFLAPRFLAAPFFDAPWLSWIGLSTVEPATNDWRPLLPWSGGLLAGVAFARSPGAIGALERDAKKWEPVFRAKRALSFWNRSLYLLLTGSAQKQRDPGFAQAVFDGGVRGVAGAVGWLGRHSLAIYLLHQPLLFGVFFALARLTAPTADEVAKNFVTACEMRCEADGGAIEFCQSTCLCVEARARESDLPSDPEQRASRLQALAADCVKP